MPKEKPTKGSLNWAILSLLFAISWIVFGGRNMQVDFMPQQVWFWLNTVVGFGGIITIAIIIFTSKGNILYNKSDTKLDAISDKLDTLLNKDNELNYQEKISNLNKQIREGLKNLKNKQNKL